MDAVLISINQIATMFVIILVGIICYKIGLISDEGRKTLSAVVLNVVNPAVIFMSYQVDFDKSLLIGLGTAIGLSVLSFIVTILIANLFVRKKGNEDFNIERIAVVYSNCGFIGIPLVSALIGSEGVFYVAAYLTVFNVFLWTHGVILMTGTADVKSTCKALITPCIIAVLLGVLFFVTGVRLPGFASNAVEFLGSMNTPLAMIVAGATIAQTNIVKALKNVRIHILTFIKLIIIPAAAVFLMLPFAKMGVERNIYMMVIIAAACPTGASGTLFAIRYNGNALYASELFGVTTFLSAVSIPIVMLLADFVI